jgi:hypothetical protein
MDIWTLWDPGSGVTSAAESGQDGGRGKRMLSYVGLALMFYPIIIDR